MNLTNTNKEAADKVVSLFYDWKLYPEFEAIADLQDWSLNFEGASPFLVFLDLIGYSNDRLVLLYAVKLQPVSYHIF